MDYTAAIMAKHNILNILKVKTQDGEERMQQTDYHLTLTYPNTLVLQQGLVCLFVQV